MKAPQWTDVLAAMTSYEPVLPEAREFAKNAAQAAAAVDRAGIWRALVKHRGHVGKTAEALGLVRRTLDRKIDALHLRADLNRDYPVYGHGRRRQPRQE